MAQVILCLAVHLARELAMVGLLNGTSVLSYSGFLTVNKTFNSNMFFWFFPSQVNITPGFSASVGIIAQLNLWFSVGFCHYFALKFKMFGPGSESTLLLMLLLLFFLMFG